MTQLKDSMSNIDKIRQEIERLKKWSESSKKEWIDEGYNQNAFAEDCRIKSFDKLLAFIDSLPEEIPSYCTGFKGDPDPPGISDLEQAAEEYAYRGIPDEMKPYVKPVGDEVIKNFIAGAKWQAKQLLKGSPLPEDTVLFQKGVEEGRRLEREDGRAWQDIKSIVQIADKMLDDPKARMEYQNHNEEYYYKRVLDEYELHKTKAE